MKFKGSKKILSFLMSMVLIVSCFAVPVVAKADTATVTSKSGIIVGNYGGNNNVRHDGLKYNIVNDGSGDNTSAAFWSFSLSSIDSTKVINSANVIAVGESYDTSISGLTVDFYYINPLLASSYVAEGGTNNTVDGLNNAAADSRHQWFVDNFNLSDNNKICSIDHKVSGNHTIDLKTAVQVSRLNGWSDVCVMAILNKNNGNADSKWSDYHVTMGDLSVDYSDATISDLRNAITAYESKMDGTIYTNMKTAYNAYLTAVKVYDAYAYGDSDKGVSTATANLIAATANMSAWSSYTAAKTSTLDGASGVSGINGVLYSGVSGTSGYNYGSDVTGDSTKSWGTTYACVGNVELPDTSFLYDGKSEPQTAINFGFGCSNNGTAKVYNCYLGSDGNGEGPLSLVNEYWKGDSSTKNFANLISSSDIISARNSQKELSRKSKTWYFHSNYIKLDNSKISFSDGEYIKQYKPTFYFQNKMDNRTIVTSQITYNSSLNRQITVFNYKAVLDKIDSTKSYLSNIANYKEGGLSSLFDSIESLMKDPNSFFTSSNDYSSCESYFKGEVNTFNSTVSSITADTLYSTEYQTLRDAITNAKTAPTAKTADSLVAYGNAIKDAKDVFANIVDTGYISTNNPQSKATAITTAYNALTGVDTDDAYSNFEAAVTVVNAMDKDAFKNQDEVTNQINSAKAKVYTTLTDSADIEAYTLATGTAPTADLKNSTSVDTVTKELLDFANEPSANLIKDIAVTFGAQIQKDNNDPVTAGETNNTYKYGTMVTFDANSFDSVSALGDSKSIKWIVNYTDGTISKFATNTTSITIKATKGMTVTANVIDETPNAEAANYTVKLYNIYNNVVDYAYVSKALTAGFHEGSSIDVNGKAWTIDIPFYTLTGFDVAVYESSKTITVKPHYDAVNTVSVNVINGSATGNKLTDNSAVKSSSVYISTEADHFYAWANVKGDKYQIISYNKDYGYAAISDGNYTPVVKENGTYYVYTSDSQKTELKASMIDQFKNNSNYKLSDNDYLFTKLNNYAPFTYIEDDSQSADGKYRVFIRVTSGSNDEYKKAFDSFGVYGYGSKIPFTTVNEISGQYTFTSSVLPSDFNAYVSYKMTYTDKTGSYSITTTDFAKNA